MTIHTDPDVLLIDEVIGVGDQAFYARTLERFHELQSEGKTILLASHSTDLVGTLCQRVLWLDHGAIVQIGPTREVLSAYEGLLAGAATVR